MTQRDSGYAWVILCAAFLNNMVASSVGTSPAVYMVDWMEYLSTTNAQIGLAASLNSALACFTGLFMAPFIHRFGFRVTSIVGTTLCVLGYSMALFSTTVWWLHLSYGIIAGIGQGMHSIVPVIIVQHYFDKRRAMASGISMIGHSMGPFVMMPFLRFLIEIYGWRGAMLIQLGTVLQVYMFGCLYRTPDTLEFGKSTNKETNSSTETKKKNCLQTVTSFFKNKWNLTLFKNRIFIQLWSAVMLGSFSLDIMYKFTPLKAVASGVDKVQASFLPSITGLFSTLFRIIVSLIADLPCVNRTLILGSAFFLQGCFTIISTFAWDFISLACCLAFFGAFTGARFTVSTTVTVDLMGLSQVAYVSSFVSGGLVIPLVTALPMAGLMADKTGNYNLPYYIYGALHVIGGILMLTITLLQKKQKVPSEQQKTGQSQEQELKSITKLKEESLIFSSLHSLNSM